MRDLRAVKDVPFFQVLYELNGGCVNTTMWGEEAHNTEKIYFTFHCP
jgi:hypothetical protein